MCGIFGLISDKEKNINLKNICNYANEIQAHRGPNYLVLSLMKI